MGQYSNASGPSSPGTSSYTPALLRGGTSAYMPVDAMSPDPVSPSTPSVRGESQSVHSSYGLNVRPSIETSSERTLPGLAHNTLAQVVPLEPRRDGTRQLAASSNALNSNIDPRLSQDGSSSAYHPRRSNRFPSVYQDTSDTSSKSSIGSSLSGPSTAPSSLQYSPRPSKDNTKPALSLPPLSIVGLAPGGPRYTDPISRPVLIPLASQTGTPYVPSQQSQSPLAQPLATGMKFESLQLPLPHNVSFGQRPLPRPSNEEKLTNIFDLQDITRERQSFKNLSLEQLQRSATPTSYPELPEPRHPPHQASLPGLPPMTARDRSPQEHTLHPNADPLSVLAYAGRIVGREDYSPS